MTDEYEHPYFDHRLDGINYAITSIGVTAEEAAEAFRHFGAAVSKRVDELSLDEKKAALFGDEVEIAEAECIHCGNTSDLRDRRNNCIGCGGPR